MIHGIDISNNNGPVDMKQVAKGYDFVFIKATESNYFQDGYFWENWNNAKAEGLVRGAYHFARPSNNADATTEAYYFLNYIKHEQLEPGDILILDQEDEQFNGECSSWTKFWFEIVNSIVGYNGILYTGPWYLDSRMQQRADFNLQDYVLWLAAYTVQKPDCPAPWTEFPLWQHTSKGQVAGINGDVDLNVFYGTKDDLRLLGKPGIVKPPTPVVDVEAVLEQVEIIMNQHIAIELCQNQITTALDKADAAIETIKRLLGGS